MLLLGPLLSVASAAVVTEIPPFLRGDIVIGYTYQQLSGSLVERGPEDAEVGQRTLSEHVLDYSLVFGVAPGAAVFIDLPHYVSSRVSYDTLYDMVYDPSTGSGTYQGAQGGVAGTYLEGNGLGGIWIGARGTPYSEAFVKRNNAATWLLEGAIRTGDKTSFWNVGDEGKRGAGPGGMGVRLRSAFSKTFKGSTPYVSFTYTGNAPQTGTVTAVDGTAQADLEIDPANELDLKLGVELLAAQNAASGSLVAFDLHMGVAYASWASLPSGFYLPNVLGASAGSPVVVAESMEPGAGIGLHWRPFTNMQIGIRADFAYHMPQRVEYPYAIYTGDDTLRVVAASTLGVRFR